MPDLKKTAENLKAWAEKARNTKSTRLWFMVALAVILFALWWIGKIKTGFAIGLGIVILAAIGIETFNYDLDLGSLWAGKSIAESRVTHTKDGLKLMGSCIIPIKWDKNDLNCANFQTQPEAQAKYNQCADDIASYNEGVDTAKVKSLDIYGLDGDKDGVVCEALPGAQKILESEEDVTKPTTKKPAGTTTSTTKTTETSGNFQTTPLLRTGEPYPVTEASDRSTPKALPAK